MKNGPYILVVAPEEYPGKKYRGRYIYEHHFVWWQATGEVLPKGIEIHHINGKHKDNRLKNLARVTSLQHRQFHYEQNGLRDKPAKRVSRECAHCGIIFERRNSDFNKGYKRYFCCKSHQVTVQQKERWERFRGTMRVVGKTVNLDV